MTLARTPENLLEDAVPESAQRELFRFLGMHGLVIDGDGVHEGWQYRDRLLEQGDV